MPVAWDRLADATNLPAAGKLPLSVITLGHVHTEDLVALTAHVARLEQLVLDVPPRDPLAKHRAELNRAIDAAASDWILIVREREVCDDALAREIVAAAESGRARGFRIRSLPIYAGRPLHLGERQGEVRLFHRRYYMRFANRGDWDEIMIQGSLVRLSAALRSMTFSSAEDHRGALAARAAPHSRLRRCLLFAGYVAGARTLDANTLRYLWIEAGYDVPLGPSGPGE